MKDYSNDLMFIFLHKVNYFLFQKYRFFGSRKLGRTLSKLLLPKHYTHSIISTIYNFKIILPPKNNFEIEELYYLGFYEAGTLHVIKKILKQDDVFIDVGASVGLMSLYAAKLVGPKGKIWAFEPIEEMALLIKKSAELNGYNNIAIFECALGDKETTLPIYTNRACPSLIEKNNEISTHYVTVKILDKIIEEQKLENIKMIKIDVEGFELQVLKGCEKLLSSSNAPVLCIEYEGTYQNKAVFEYLQKINQYKFYQLKKGKALESELEHIPSVNQLKINDNVFCMLD